VTGSTSDFEELPWRERIVTNFNFHHFLNWLRNTSDETVLFALISRMAVVGFTLIGAWILVRLTRIVADRVVRMVEDDDPTTINEREKRARTLAGIFKGVARVVIMIVATLTILAELNIPTAPLIASAGVAGLAISFGAQDLIRDVISGFFILLENQFKVGDVIRAAGVSGMVEDMNLRVTVLRDTDGAAHFIPNGEIKLVSNLAKEWSRAVINVGIAYTEDVERVLGLLRQVGEQLSKEPSWASYILDSPQVLGIESFEQTQITIRVLIKTRPLRQWEIGREYRRRVKIAFDEKGVATSQPQIIVAREEPSSRGK
jgi:small-conductance mechanosensitive channel